MRAGEHDGIDLRGFHRGEIFLEDELRGRVRQPVFLDERNEERCGHGGDLTTSGCRRRTGEALIGLALDRALRANDADALVARGRERRLHAGDNDADDRNVRFLLQDGERVGRGGVARDAATALTLLARR